MFESVARTYSAVFAPEYFVLVCAVALIVYEWRAPVDRRHRQLASRFGVLVFGWVVAFAIYESAPAVFPASVTWRTDFMGSLGLAVGVLLIWAAWRRWEWGEEVPEFCAMLVGLTAVHLAITPFWDVSSHVAYAVAPAGFLAAVDRRFFPLLIVPVGMVFARPLAGAHTWLQSIGGVVLGGAALGVWIARRR